MLNDTDTYKKKNITENVIVQLYGIYQIFKKNLADKSVNSYLEDSGVSVKI